jgi:hypothetical protein
MGSDDGQQTKRELDYVAVSLEKSLRLEEAEECQDPSKHYRWIFYSLALTDRMSKAEVLEGSRDER